MEVQDEKQGAEQESSRSEIPDVPENYYERLGVKPDATQEEIERAYREKIKEYHPDLNKDDPVGSHEWAVGLNEARDTFSDAKKRKVYDEQGEKIRKEREEKRRREEKNKEATLARIRREVNDDGDTKSGEDERDFDPTHPNPFWKEQEALLTPWDRFMGNIAGGIGWPFKKGADVIKAAARTAKDFSRMLKLEESPNVARKTWEEYEQLRRNGQAELVNENSGVSYADYRLMQAAHRKTGNFKGYYFRSVGVYDEKGRFAGKVRTYRIKTGA